MTTDWFLFRAETSADSVAIITAQDQKSYTYKSIHDTACKGAAYFQSQGIKKGDKIAIIAYNCIEYIYLFSIAQKLGIILVPINYRLTHFEIETLINLVDPVMVLTDLQHANLPSHIPHQQSLDSLFDEIRNHGSTEFQSPKVDLEDALFILYTSGSSGIPKGVQYTHKMLFWNSINTIMSLKINSNTSTIVCMPPFHTGGWNVLLTPLIHLGGTSIIATKFDPNEVLQLLEKHKCSIFMGVPTMLKIMASHPSFQSTSLDALDYIIVGGEAMPVPLIEVYHNKGIYIRQGYGMTEAGPNLTSLHENDAIRKIGSIGKPNMYVEVRILKSDGRIAKTNERGELQIKGPMTMKKYYKNPEETAKSLDDDWLSTGDIAIQDDEGYLYIVDRIKNMFISGGENVYPAEIEKVIKSHPYISEVIVIAEKHEKWGESGKAILSLHQNKSISLTELQSFCAEKLSKYKIPKSMLIVSEIPKNETGKLDRNKVLEKYSTQTKTV